jgi:Transposase IS200 like
MTIARSQQIDASVTRWYHCMTRCVRRASLLDEGKSNRKEWLENRLEELAEIFAVGVGGFSVMDNHLHLLLRLDPEIAQGWSDQCLMIDYGHFLRGNITAHLSAGTARRLRRPGDG